MGRVIEYARMSDVGRERGTFKINVPFVCEGENVIAFTGFDRFDGAPLVVFEMERDTDEYKCENVG